VGVLQVTGTTYLSRVPGFTAGSLEESVLLISLVFVLFYLSSSCVLCN